MNVWGDFLGSPHGTNTTGVVCKKGKRKVQGVPQSQTAALPRPVCQWLLLIWVKTEILSSWWYFIYYARRLLLCKMDLKSAYRSLRLSEHSQKVTGLKWNFNGTDVYLKDTRLSFGAKLSPDIFHRLTQAVKRMMGLRGYDLLIV